MPLDPTAKVTGPRLLHSSQWGYIDPVDTPDGGNCGLHKHMSISTYVTSGTSYYPMLNWLRTKTTMKLLVECNLETIGAFTKIMVNGRWVGVLNNPVETIALFKLYRRIGVIPTYNSISFMYSANEIHIYTDGGRLTRPVYYVQNKNVSYSNPNISKMLVSDDFTWGQAVCGFKTKKVAGFYINAETYYDINDLYQDYQGDELETVGRVNELEGVFKKDMSIIDYIDTSEERAQYITTNLLDLQKKQILYSFGDPPISYFGCYGEQYHFPRM